MVNDGSPDSKNILMLLVDMDTSGLTIGEEMPIMGLKAMSCCDLELNNCIVSKKRLLSDKVDKNIFEAIENSQILMPSIAIGIAQRVIDLTVNYLGRRISFDKPIIQRQGVQWTLADLSTKVEAGRWLAYRTASLRDRKKNISLQALKNKLYATEVTMETTTKCLQLFGAQGYADNSVVSKNWALAKLLQIVDAIPEI
jgi:butyryl-CoA dehydrogenase